MEKHNNMVLQNKERSQAKVDKAIKAIHKMLDMMSRLLFVL